MVLDMYLDKYCKTNKYKKNQVGKFWVSVKPVFKVRVEYILGRMISTFTFEM